MTRIYGNIPSRVEYKISKNIDDIQANSSAVTSLQTTVTDHDGIITATASAITALQSTVTDPDKGVLANSESLNSLHTQVIANGETIATNASNISTAQSDLIGLQGDVTGNETEISANSGAVDSLQTNVTKNGGDIATNASNISSTQSDITTLQQDVDGNTTEISANSGAVNSLQTQVMDNEGGISTNASNISIAKSSLSDIEQRVAGTASVKWDQSIPDSTLKQTEPVKYAKITWNQASPDSAVKVKRYSVTLGTSQAINSLQTAVTQNEDGISTNASNIGMAQSDIVSLQGDVAGNTNNIGAHSTAISNMQTAVTQNEDGISTNASNISGAQSDINDNAHDIHAHASSILTLQTDVAGKADASAVAILSSRVTGNDGDINQAFFLLGADKTHSWIDMESDEINLVAGSGSGEVSVSTQGSSSSSMFWAGGSRNSAPYMVKPDGTLFAVNAHVSGKLKGNSGYLKSMNITGRLTMKSGGIIDMQTYGRIYFAGSALMTKDGLEMYDDFKIGVAPVPSSSGWEGGGIYGTSDFEVVIEPPRNVVGGTLYGSSRVKLNGFLGGDGYTGPSISGGSNLVLTVYDTKNSFYVASDVDVTEIDMAGTSPKKFDMVCILNMGNAKILYKEYPGGNIVERSGGGPMVQKGHSITWFMYDGYNWNMQADEGN